MAAKDKSGFFRRVYYVVRLIPAGQVATYGQIAKILEHPRAARTVGWALHSLPSDIEVPWQRVVNAKGGVCCSEQRVLLEAEGVSFDVQGRAQLAAHRWPGLDWAQLEALRGHKIRDEEE